LLPVGERYRRLKLHPETGNRLRKELLRAGFVEPLHINTGKARITLFEITELGRQYLREIGVEVKELRRRGSLEHQYWCSKVKEFYEGKGYNVEEEFSVNGGAVDLMVQKGDERILIEVETGRSDAVGNVRKCLGVGDFSRILVVTTSGDVKGKIEKELLKSGLQQKGVQVVVGKEIKEAIWTEKKQLIQKRCR